MASRPKDALESRNMWQPSVRALQATSQAVKPTPYTPVPDNQLGSGEERRQVHRRSNQASDDEIIEIYTTDDEALGPPPRLPRYVVQKTLRAIVSVPEDTPRKLTDTLRTPRARRRISSSSESETPLPGLLHPRLRCKTKTDDVIVISDSSDDESMFPAQENRICPSSTPLQDSDNTPWTQDESILELYEPKTARRPIPRPVLKPKAKRNHSQDAARSTGLSSTSGDDALFLSSNDEGITTIADPVRAPPAMEKIVPSTPDAGSSRLVSATPKTPRARRGQKAEAEAEQSRRQAYAQELFDELNASVFGGELPHVKLVWSKRLLTTAGRAKWHRSRDGVDTTEIELAMKILDCDERIRNTLSHEMCHLASWLISKEPKEHHGRIFKSWAAKVMKRRRDIEVTTRHNYEIIYAYEWKCSTCSKIYGRHSKSINPDAVLCGACKTGKLVPQFSTRGGGATPRVKTNPAKRGTRPVRDSPGHVGIISGTDPDSDPDVLAGLMDGLTLPDVNSE